MQTEYDKIKADLLTHIQNQDDPEQAHWQADQNLIQIALSETLTLEEKKKLVALWKKVPKWYS